MIFITELINLLKKLYLMFHENFMWLASQLNIVIHLCGEFMPIHIEVYV